MWFLNIWWILFPCIAFLQPSKIVVSVILQKGQKVSFYDYDQIFGLG